MTFVNNWKKHCFDNFSHLSQLIFFSDFISAYSTKLVSVKNLKMSLHLLPFCLQTFLLQVVQVRNIWFLFPRVLSKPDENILVLLSLCIFWGKCVYFQILNDKIHNYVSKNMILNFIIQTSKSKHTSIKKYINWAPLFFEESVITFQILNDEIHNYVSKKHNCEFYHSKIEK